MNEEEEEAPLEDPRIRRNCFARERHVAQFEMPTGGQLIELRVVMRKLLWMSVGGQLRKLCVAMRRLQQMPIGATMPRLRRMPIDGQLRELRTMMRKM